MKYVYARLITLLCITFLSIMSLAQNTSPVKVVEFRMIPGGIMDELRLEKNQRTDYDDNPVCEIKVKAQGFDEEVMQRFKFSANGPYITKVEFDDKNEWRIYLSSKRRGSLKIKYQGDCVFDLPAALEPKAIYELTLGMETATLNIITTPEDATIYIDGEKVGVGHGSKAVSIGAEHKYRVECADYITEENTVTFTQSEKKELNIELRPDFGYITVKSTPSGAEVYIDEKKAGATPYQMKKIKRGQHVVELRMAGYEPFADMVTIKAGEVNRQFENVTLEALRVATGTIVLESNPSGAVITIDGRQYGQTPKTLTEFPVGTYTVYFTKEGYQNLAQNLDLKDGRRETLSVTMSKTSAPQQPVATGGGVAGASGGSAAGNKINGHEYVDLGLPSGTLWATCNVGASRPEDYGNYFAWGETNTKNNYDWSTYKWCNGDYDNLTKYNTKSDYGTIDDKMVLEMSDDAARANWGGDWRMPTSAEFEELYDNTICKWTTENGVYGRKFASKKDPSKYVFLPAAGLRNGTDVYFFAGSIGYYWSGSLYSSYSTDACSMNLSSDNVNPQIGDYRCSGFSVRPVRAAR